MSNDEILHPQIASGEAGRRLVDDESMRVEELAGRIYVVRVREHLTRSLIGRALRAIWTSPNWRQPWGLVLSLGKATYDGDVREHEMPPDRRRAVGTAVVSSNAMHRVVIKSIGIGYGLVSRFALSAHETEEAGILAQREAVARAEAKSRPY